MARQVQVDRDDLHLPMGNDVKVTIFIITLLITGETGMAQISPGEGFGYEVSASWLDLEPRGNVQTNSSRVEFNSIGIDGMQSQVGLWFLAEPWHRSGLFAEFIPYRFSGEQEV